LIINLILILVGAFMDVTPAVLIFTPIFLPIVESLGMSPLHFGIMLVPFSHTVRVFFGINFCMDV
jgi:TRAP-type C4-dicarboxylate transport system permease large subunit